MAFDALWLDGKDVCDRPLHQRKRIVARIMPKVEHVRGSLRNVGRPLTASTKRSATSPVPEVDRRSESIG